jgi:hypothetical protein
MRDIKVIFLKVAALVFTAGCRSTSDAQYQPGVGGEVRSEDRNADGRIDRELHRYPGLADADWELRDENFDGVYERLIAYGYVVRTQQVSIVVPPAGRAEPDGPANGSQPARRVAMPTSRVAGPRRSPWRSTTQKPTRPGRNITAFL